VENNICAGMWQFHTLVLLPSLLWLGELIFPNLQARETWFFLLSSSPHSGKLSGQKYLYCRLQLALERRGYFSIQPMQLASYLNNVL
jgi:hypothetical protein